MKDQLATLIAKILQDMGIPDTRVDVEVPEDPAHGDYTTNIAMTVFAKVKARLPARQGKRQKVTGTLLTPPNRLLRSPMDLALQVVEQVKSKNVKATSGLQDQNIHKSHQTTSASLVSLDTLQAIDRVEAVPPGFINVFLTEANLITQLQEVLKQKEGYGTAKSQLSVPGSPLSDNGQSVVSQSVSEPLKTDNRQPKIMVEFAHPNTHKAFHIGHLRNITTGESIIRLLESQGDKVIRTNYQGDVGMHIAKAIYALLHLSPYRAEVATLVSQPQKVSPFKAKERVEFLGRAYAAGSKAFDEDPAAKDEIVSLNALIYAAAQRLATEKGIDPGTTDYLALVKPDYTALLEHVYQLWKETRQWSLDYFETVYKRVGSHYDRYYFESECLAGVDLSRAAVKRGVLKEDAGAIIFDGKPYGLDTRVFVNSLGLPTYEGKELKLATMETTEHGELDRMIHVVGPEQASFFKITFKAEELLGIVKPGVQHHLIYGWVKLKHGKMSSRSGNVVLGEWLLDEAKKAIYVILDRNISKNKSLDSSASSVPLDSSQRELIAEKAAVAAVKYAFLKVSTTSEIAFDIQTSVSFEGDSGPYLQYTYARCRSVLRKARKQESKKVERFSFTLHTSHFTLNPEERAVARLIQYFPDIVKDAADTFSPSTLCTYLFHLAQSFNLFYAKHQIVHSVKGNALSNTKDSMSDSSRFTLHASRSSLRLSLTAATAQVLATGLYLLGIEVLEQM